MFATLLYIELEGGTGRLTMANTGHLPPLIKNADGSVRRLPTAGSAPLGILPTLVFTQQLASLELGETVVLYTDGIIEAMNARDELYGFERLESLIALSPADPDVMKAAIMEDVNRFTGLSPQHDDMTLVCFGAVP